MQSEEKKPRGPRPGNDKLKVSKSRQRQVLRRESERRRSVDEKFKTKGSDGGCGERRN